MDGKMIANEHPEPHRRYLVRRDGEFFTATPCYGMHSPWWVVSTMNGESDPVPMKDSDTWWESFDAALAAREARARREGQEAMRERAARIAEGWKNPSDTNGHHECLVGQYVADDIRALPVE